MYIYGILSTGTPQIPGIVLLDDYVRYKIYGLINGFLLIFCFLVEKNVKKYVCELIIILESYLTMRN